jgi:teichuronic acid biosynthesis glycosyltransferase TuaC
MKLLVVCSKNSGKIAPFILEQGESLLRLGVEVDYYPIVGKGLVGYWKNRKLLLRKIKSYQPDIIHAHYGLSGLLANTQRNIPVVTTYLGTDINNSRVFLFSKLNMVLSRYNIFVSEKNQRKSEVRNCVTLLPYGINTILFTPINKLKARELLGIQPHALIIVFAGAFRNEIKNPKLAKEAVELIPNSELLELGTYTRQELSLLMNAADVALMTSFTEGSPQFIKEAMACNCPVVSVPVGDVPFVLQGVEGCFIADYDAVAIAEKLNMAFRFGRRTEGRKRILELGWSNEKVAEKLLSVYGDILGTKPS